ncbi:MAG: hypothetical protein WCB49_12830 [Gammaproteobacteria bacterium]
MAAVVQVLIEASEPLHVAEIHRAVERQLGREVNYRSVKGCLSEGAARRPPRFERINYGEYRLAEF